jgi:ribosomal protein S18 acetylase RimI-like enzyme
MRIEKITRYTPEIQNKVNYFLNILTGRDGNISTEQLDAIFNSPDTHLFFVFDEDNTPIGMTTLAIYNLCTGKKAWVEDVVVDSNFQGKGIGRLLMEFVIGFARNEKADLLMLTSRPTRVAANSLYQKTGFERKETNVYQMKL